MATAPGGDPGSGDAAGRPDSLPSPLDAVDDMRAAAKWMLVAAGAVGAALISGGPLVAVGQVHGVLHVILAGLGLVIALGGVGAAIWFTSQVLVPRLTTPATIRTSPDLAGLRMQVTQEPAEFFGVAAATVDGLFELQGKLRDIAASLARQAAAEKDLERRARIQAALARVEDNGERVSRYVRWLLALGHTWQVKAALERARVATLAGGVLVIVGAVLFFSVTGSSGPTYVPVVTTSPTATFPSIPTAPPPSHP